MVGVNLQGRWCIQRTDEEAYELQAQMPGDIFGALLEAKYIEDPYVGENENDVQWVGECDWIFSRTFKVSQRLLAHDQIRLHLESVDTLAKIYINDKLVVRTENMFVPVDLDVKPFLIQGENCIRLHITSAAKGAKKLAKKAPYEVPSTTNNRVPHLNHLRKVQCHGGWDWGICLLTCGVYGKMQLVGVNELVIHHCYTSQKHRKDKVTLTVTLEYEAFKSARLPLSVRVGEIQCDKMLTVKAGRAQHQIVVEIDNPALWWPVGYGEQPLYAFELSLAGQVVQKKLGLRDIRVLNTTDKIGKRFVIEVNGVEVFCKGANWIPMDAIVSRQTDQRYTELLEAAADANMNMIRVWGGGQYERDFFYETCDRLGLLVWQDFMLACALYPATEDFIQNLCAEVTHQGKRLRDHACLALWCGDNEVLGAIHWYVDAKDAQKLAAYHVFYDRINQAQQAAIEAADPTRTFWPSSPCGGPNDFSDGWHNDACGDMHYWDVWHEGKDIEAYFDVVPRFCSEFGYQSFSSPETTATFAAKKDWNPTCPVMEHHQRNPAGNQIILDMFTRYFRMPNGSENFMYLSQVQQAIAVKTAVEYWRHLKPVCMGTLYWQLNDNWPVASWSSLEYGGRWKHLHYHAKRFYAPVVGTAFQQDNIITLAVVSDVLEAGRAVMLVKSYDFEGNLIKKIKLEKAIAAQGVVKFGQWDVDAFGVDPTKGFMVLETCVKVRGKAYYHDNTHLFRRYKQYDLPETAVRMRLRKHPEGASITLSVKYPAFFVFLSHEKGGVFEDNSFTLLPDQPKTIIFRVNGGLTLQQIKQGLSVKHLRDTYE